ncbi:SDR family oxidoreductase [Candidatus Cyanaurora vandensis]|uniref:SDR family oxidoreductase n=1 Tax=Candidatus Cyanaurora vandensis TaxID=2714958 RepID=UPI00257B12A0|nr:SDR family oxidoreductase [Candidatus Cyanaurora vandensis]
MDGKVVLITGATGGIGTAVAQKLAASGARLVLASRQTTVLESLTARCHEWGSPETLSIPTDVTDRLQVESLFEQVYQKLGQLDVVINGAGLGVLKPIQQLSEVEFDRMVAVNLKGTFLVCQQAVARWMQLKASGRVFNIPGILGQHPMGNASGYCASKYGVVGFTKAMALDCKRFDIKFTLLYLGGLDTPFWENAGMKVQRDKMLKPEQAADAIYFALQVPAPGVPSEIVIQPDSHLFL